MEFRNVQIKPLVRTPTFRKIALGTWDDPGDPQIYGMLEVDLTKVNEWRAQYQNVEPKVTMTHIVAKVMAVAMEKFPDLNGYVRFNKIYLRESIDIFFQVATNLESNRPDLTGMRIAEVNKKSVFQIAKEMKEKLQRIREKQDTDIQNTARLLNKFPSYMMRLILDTVSFLSYTLNINVPGIPSDQFGGVMISNIGSLGMDMALAPLVPYSRVPLIIIIGSEKKRPRVVGDRIEIRDTVTLNATIDHRFCDGALVSKMVKVIEACFDDPETYFGKPEA